MFRVAAILVLVAVGAGTTSAQKEQLFPHTKKHGRATVEYKNQGFTVVANYDYSQRNHGAPWLLIDVAAGSTTRFVIHRDNFTLVTPDERTLKLTSQEDLIADSAGMTLLLQNAKIHRHNLDSYFPQRNAHDVLKFYSFPGLRSVSHEGVVDNDRVTLGELFFRSPEGRWPPGTYRLAIDNAKATAALPITLE